MNRQQRFALAPYSSLPSRLLSSRSILATGAVALTILVLFRAGIQAHNAHLDRSTTFDNSGPIQSLPPSIWPTSTPTPTPTPNPAPDCLNTPDLVALIDRPVLPQASDRLRTATGSATNASDCLSRYSGRDELIESPDCIVAHEATPAQLCMVGDGYQYYFIGTDQTEAGPYLATVETLSELHPNSSESIELYRGQNPLTSKSVVVEYLPDEEVLRVSTYYADTATSTNKPYVFTIGDDHGVTHESW